MIYSLFKNKLRQNYIIIPKIRPQVKLAVVDITSQVKLAAPDIRNHVPEAVLLATNVVASRGARSKDVHIRKTG